ncbi:HlyD family type I secretion periplasmic adaptor subunit [Methyloceanibacter caenitepidi]|uniref:Membrane fusion protein (MFP) family protein n=1 Tax=Methyloceanibacter caenitepidi TaxID=1384459 RepID=A0A0A8K401_9HYPH|nr:HlyD family type I secretion periplasmic adaptor subunit [Methyloceanibacter caenitepidi]BAQ16724.1 HlyD family secretion protein [Methyloceanibacter caenitepidi]
MFGNRSLQSSLRRHVLIGLIVAALLVFGVGVWAATTVISGAIIAPGKVVVESSVKRVQHPTGGVVGELLVHEGDRVKQGNVLLRLDATQTRANLGIVAKSIDELEAREARLEAEKIGADDIEFPSDLMSRQDDPVVAKLVRGERKLFELRRNARDGQKAQLRERVAQLREEIRGLGEQVDAKSKEIALLKKELAGVRDLWRKNLVQITRLTALERDEARLEGERGQLTASIAQAKGKIAEVELQIIQVDELVRSEVAEEISDGRAKLSELAERKVAAEDQLKRIDIRAPQDGIVHQLEMHTIGGVVAPGEPIMLIVPEADKLTVEAQVSPKDIDQVRQGQTAMLRFSAFDQGTTPAIPGEVERIGADLSEDEKSGMQYYVVRVAIDEERFRQLGGMLLVPGMPVEAFIETEPHTVISYLIKPLKDQLARAFRET